MVQSIPITDYRDLDKLCTRVKQHRNAAISHLRPINMIDTETYEGNVFLIADSDGKYRDKNIDAESIIEFLFYKKYHNAWNFFYNLGYDAEVILKLLGVDKLIRYKQTKKLSFCYGETSLHYISNKCLRLKRGHHSVLFHDIAQYYGTDLVDAYQKNIGPLPQDYLDFKKQRAEFSPRFYRRNTSRVRNYCIDDCIYGKRLAEKWVTLFHDAFGFYLQRWLSPGYAAEKVLIYNQIAFPTFNSIQYEIQKLALRASVGGRFEQAKRGYIGEAWLYDLNAAYPKAISQIPDLMAGEWIYGNNQNQGIESKAKMGYFKILADIPDCKYITPFPFRVNSLILFPSGKFITYVTLDELRACEDPKYYEILESYQFIPNDPEHYPYKDFIEKWYDKRLELKRQKNPLQQPIKLILNSIYGKTGQKINKVIGNLFNAVIFSYITGYTRSQIYNFIIRNMLEKYFVGTATDSICVTKDLHLDSQKLGEFSFKEYAEDVYYLQNGFYRFNQKWKQRGLGKLEGKEIENIETFERDEKLYCKLSVNRNTRLRSAIIQDKISEIGQIRPIIREINLNADRKRFWIGRLTSIQSNDHNDSLPISFNQFKKEEI